MYNYIENPGRDKEYVCDRCGHKLMIHTNHYGKTYNTSCTNCSWKNPMQPFVTWTCTEKPPAGMGLPPKWKSVRLG